MIGQKLTNILQSLDEEEFKRLKKALSSPYFATNPKMLVIYDYLKKYYPQFDETKLDREKFFSKLYPGKRYNEGMFRVIIREFSAVVEDYIMLERLRADKVYRKQALVREYGDRNLYNYFKKGSLELIADLDETGKRDMDYFSTRINHYQLLCFHPLTDKYTTSDAIQALMDSLDAYFMLAKHRFAQVMKNNDTVFKRNSDVRFWDIVVEDAYHLFEKFPLIGIYNNLNRLHETSDEKYYFESKALFEQYQDNMGRIDQQIIYFLHLNYCARMNNAGVKGYSTESLGWYKLGLENGLLMEKGIISDITFTNICIMACKENELVWAEGFVAKYQDMLNPDGKEDAVEFSKMILSFFSEKYHETVQIFNLRYFSKKYQLTARVYAIMALYEIMQKDFNYYSVLFAQIEANKKYLLRDTTFNETNKAPVKTFLNIIDRFAKMLVDKKENDKIRNWLEHELNSDKPLAGKAWLKEKCQEL